MPRTGIGPPAAVAALAVAVLWSVGAAAETELRRIFEQLIENPTDTELNMRYAREAEAQGELRKALGAYERVLINDPDNGQAKAEIARIKRALAPEFTDVTVVLGADYESNVRQLRDADDADDFAFGARVALRDERKVDDLRWRTNGQAFANVHAEFGQLDYGVVAADTGPILPLAAGWTVRPGVGARYAWLDGETLLYGGSVHLNFENAPTETLQRVDIGAGYDEIGGAFSNRDAFYVDISPRFVWREVAADGDFVAVRPRYRFDGGTGDEPNDRFVRRDIFPERFHHVGARVDYFTPLAPWAFGGVNFEASWRAFNGQVPGGDDGRRDTYIAPGTMVVFPDAFLREHDVMLTYTYEHNVSNDGVENYQNHIVGLRSIWRF